jgi:hypothetical protein
LQLNLYTPQLLGEHIKLHDSLDPAFDLGSAPFCMTVLNIQPATLGHRDDSDMVDSICLVMALGEFHGGELCLYEAGVVIELPPGGVVAIRSKRDLHFNLDFIGQRMSFVFTSDKGLERWEKDRNGWLSVEGAL